MNQTRSRIPTASSKLECQWAVMVTPAIPSWLGQSILRMNLRFIRAASSRNGWHLRVRAWVLACLVCPARPDPFPRLDANSPAPGVRVSVTETLQCWIQNNGDTGFYIPVGEPDWVTKSFGFDRVTIRPHMDKLFPSTVSLRLCPSACFEVGEVSEIPCQADLSIQLP